MKQGRNVDRRHTSNKCSPCCFYCISLRLEGQGDEVKTGGNETDTYLRVLGCPSDTVAKEKGIVLEFKTIPQKIVRTCQICCVQILQCDKVWWNFHTVLGR